MQTRGGGNSHRGLGINVPALVMCKFAIFCPGYRSCFLHFGPVYGSALERLGLLMGKW